MFFRVGRLDGRRANMAGAAPRNQRFRWPANRALKPGPWPQESGDFPRATRPARPGRHRAPGRRHRGCVARRRLRGAVGRSGRRQDHAGARHPAGAGRDRRCAQPHLHLVQRYETPRLVVNHYDLYRLKQPREMDELGFDEALEDGAVLVEWPERAPEALPPDALHVRLALADDGARTRETDRPGRGCMSGQRPCLNAKPPCATSWRAPAGARPGRRRCPAMPPPGAMRG